MSLCQDGLDTKTKGGGVITIIEDSDPLIQLTNLIDWNHLAALAQPDLPEFGLKNGHYTMSLRSFLSTAFNIFS